MYLGGMDAWMAVQLFWRDPAQFIDEEQVRLAAPPSTPDPPSEMHVQHTKAQLTRTAAVGASAAETHVQIVRVKLSRP